MMTTPVPFPTTALKTATTPSTMIYRYSHFEEIPNTSQVGSRCSNRRFMLHSECYYPFIRMPSTSSLPLPPSRVCSLPFVRHTYPKSTNVEASRNEALYFCTPATPHVVLPFLSQGRTIN
ncbi:hypothetical protein Pmar_PMAR003257 [Perkinsus marinus ATCC 50983]|uniref:Uncharacterized protein n=1 Tax=Perkinsus marinus (strain ATCC 50983 / TXsc) TaxID=423536 RepID=C5L5Q7_PERM5|nr:hypothetical protein Pmar_PMAR003257 [Perkinsus marinus ATCC 50983]EER07938.1 hypothetical protein Pmar_PMAR003257 [Perkinsus marinus ATCC 50983]|eukprot:XP_002776122.1 hypothetical protein Pmar_PMAR003257 [Perkinsus marinus ATCC 50983]